jgi:polysaccharide biosynthesis protein PslH
VEPLVFLTHRIPFPPNKGDKVRSYHLLKHLAQRYRLLVGTVVDDPDDWRHVDALRDLCLDLCVVGVSPRVARVKSLAGLLRQEALTLPYYRHKALQVWVDRVIAEHAVKRAIVFSSAMAQYLDGYPTVTTLVDFVDVDSAKWGQYAETKSGPVAWIYRRESTRLLAYERAVAQRAIASTFVTPAETALFQRLAPEVHGKASAVSNGVNTEFFAPDPHRANPFPPTETPIVFTGAMDYWPNIDAAVWFATDIMPRILESLPNAKFYVVGMNPAPAVRALAERGDTVVTGRVDDVRPYVQYAAIAVAPLRIARGVQNKVLEAMAMARAVVTTPACAIGVGASAGVELEVAESSEAFAAAVVKMVGTQRAESMGLAARAHVCADYNWDRNMSGMVDLLEARA